MRYSNEQVRAAFEKVAGQGAATGIGAVAPIFSGLAAEKGKGWRTSGGSVAGLNN